MISYVVSSLLSSSSELSDIVGTNIFADYIEEDATLPLVFYQVDKTEFDYTLNYDEEPIENSNVKIYTFSYDKKEMLNMVEVIKSIFNRFHGIVSGQDISDSYITYVEEGHDYVAEKILYEAEILVRIMK